ncbi:MAG: single-stranded-DNA-specific exonuclease RecJ [Candidatus Aminicenantes bacterium]|nr:single-stranded-DNA-specific exonuclease RecJ [Candidatus Aminicenantes bacterium]
MEDARWEIPEIGAAAKALAAELRIPLPLAQVLTNRKLGDAAAARVFLHGTTADLFDPYLFTDMAAAVARIERAIAEKQTILIFGDYDVDGVLSTVMLHKALRDLGGIVEYFIPERLTDGYGIKDEHLEVVKARGASLVISVDCGIRAEGFAAKATEAGIDLIITDHHLPGDAIPAAIAVIDPVVASAGYPERGLAGVGVVYKLIQALFERAGKSKSLRHYLKLVAIGTISDIAPLLGENRILVKEGLKLLEETSILALEERAEETKSGKKGSLPPGLPSLLDASGLLGRKVTEGDIGFRIGPRINAAGRMGQTDLAVRLFFSDDLAETREIARRLDELNRDRQEAEEAIFRQAEEKVRSRGLDSRYRILILGSESWHRGIIGIVASRLKDAFNRPVILFSYADGKAHGSGRSISDYSLIDCLDTCRGHVLTYGGHTYAVGCTLMRDNLPAFKAAANADADAHITDDLLRRRQRVDAEVSFPEIDRVFLGVHALLSPFGVGNPRPVFATRGVEIAAGPQVLKGKHLKMWLRQGERTFEALAWDRADWADRLPKGGRVDIAYTFLFSTYNGESRLQLSLEGIKP